MFPTIPAADTQLYALEARLGALAGRSSGRSRSTYRWERILGRCPPGQTDRPVRWLGSCPTASNCSTSKMPRWSPTTRPVDCSCLSLATGHPALGRVGRLVLTNCDNYDQFPPDALRKASALSRALPRLVRALLRLQLRSATARRKIVSTVAASGLDHERVESFFGPARRDQRVADDLVAALAGFRPQLLIDAAEAIPGFDRPVLLIWGESCDFFPMTDAERLASEFPRAKLVSVPEAKTWVPIDNPAAVADAITKFVPTPVT
jgi:hypothetical protein